MREILALFGAALRRRLSAYWQFLAATALLSLVGAMLLLTLFSAARPTAVGLLLLALLVAAGTFAYGAALGAVGESVRAGAPSPLLRRALWLWPRTLLLLLLMLLGGLLLLALCLVALGALGLTAALPLALFGGYAPSGAAFAAAAREAGILLVTLLCLSFLAGPFFLALQAGVYAGPGGVLAALRAAPRIGYGRGRLGIWLCVVLAGYVLGLVVSLLQAALGSLGPLPGLLLLSGLLWAQAALAFSAYRVLAPPAS